MPATGATNLERQIRSQPEALAALLSSANVRRQVHEAAERLHRARRLWVVGTGTSLHAAELGASLIQLSGRQAHAVPAMEFVDFAPLVGPQDGIVVITHTGRDGVRALHPRAGVLGRARARHDHQAWLRVPRRHRDGRQGDLRHLHGQLFHRRPRVGDAREGARRGKPGRRRARPGPRRGRRGHREPVGRRRRATRAGAGVRGSGPQRRHGPRRRAQGPGGLTLPGGGLRRRVPAPWIGRSPRWSGPRGGTLPARPKRTRRGAGTRRRPGRAFR